MKLLFGVICVLGLCSSVPAAAADWPLSPRPEVVRGFEPPPEPWLPGHRGVDLLGRVGQQVRSPVAGTILYAGPLAGRGVIVVSHGETRTTYEPVRASVRVGDQVARGAPLGTLSSVPSHCAPRVCLHWGLIRGSTYLDPLTLLGSVPVRLLPLSEDPHPSSSDDPRPSLSDDPRVGADAQPPAVPAGGGPASATPGSAGESSVAGGLAVAATGLVVIGGALLIGRH